MRDEQTVNVCEPISQRKTAKQGAKSSKEKAAVGCDLKHDTGVSAFTAFSPARCCGLTCFTVPLFTVSRQQQALMSSPISKPSEHVHESSKSNSICSSHN
jgi:hypothetical protein